VKQQVKHARNSEDDVEVFYGQQIFLPGLEPAGLVEGLAFWTMAVETGVVEIVKSTAMVALMHMAAKSRRSTIENVAHRR